MASRAARGESESQLLVTEEEVAELNRQKKVKPNDVISKQAQRFE
jgi:hypothetical protein